MLRIALTPGEPAGIGPDLCLLQELLADDVELVVIADPELLRERAGLWRWVAAILIVSGVVLMRL